MWCFVHFDLQMCFSLQRRAIFPHPDFKKWSEHVVFCTFWLANVLLATAACNFSTSQIQKVVWDRQFFSILTSKCASRYSGVQFFLCPLQSYLRTRRFSEVTFRPSRHTKHWKTQHFATSLTFRACWSSFFPHLLIFFLAALLFQLSILSEVRLLNFLRSLNIVRKVMTSWPHLTPLDHGKNLCTGYPSLWLSKDEDLWKHLITKNISIQ